MFPLLLPLLLPQVPLWLVFQNGEKGADNVIVMFKAGDDLRQDTMVLQLLQVMDEIWQANDLDLCLSTYRCVPTWHDGGMLEIESDCRHVGPSCRRRDFHSCVGTGIDAIVTRIDAVQSYLGTSRDSTEGSRWVLE